MAAGIEAWGQDGPRIERLRKAAEFAIYTPGSTAGLPVSVLASFAAPAAPVRADAELLGERRGTPPRACCRWPGSMRRREAGSTPCSPPCCRTRGRRGGTSIWPRSSTRFRPPRSRRSASSISNILSAARPLRPRDAAQRRPRRAGVRAVVRGGTAGPGRSPFHCGRPSAGRHFLDCAPRRPGADVLRLAAASRDVGWTRAQTGTASLRAVLYMDDIAGYFPPVANPPSKPPLLTLLKSGRAFGLGVVLATQNPVTSITRGCRTSARGSSAGCRRRRTRRGCWTGWRQQRRATRSRRCGSHADDARQARVPAAQRAREQACRLSNTMDALVSARPVVARSDSRPHVPQRRAGRHAGGGAAPGRRSRQVVSRGGCAAGRSAGDPAVLHPTWRSGGLQCARVLPAILGAARVTFSDPKLGIDVSRDVIYGHDRKRRGRGGLDGRDTARFPGRGPAPCAGSRRLARAPAAGRDAGEDYRLGKRPSRGGSARPRRSSCCATASPGWRRSRASRSATSGSGCRTPRAPRATKRLTRSGASTPRSRRRWPSGCAAPKPALRASPDRHRSRRSRRPSRSAPRSWVISRTKGVSASTLGRATTAARGVGRSMKNLRRETRVGDRRGRARAGRRARGPAARGDADGRRQLRSPVELERVTLLPKRGQVLVHFVALGWDPQ